MKLKSFSLFALASLVTAPVATASPDSPAPPLQRPTMAANAVDGAHVLKYAFIKTGGSGATTPGGNVVLDTTDISCTNAAGCTIGFEMTENVGGSSRAGGALWSLCGLVDGNYASPGCPYLGEVPGDGSYVNGSAVASMSVSKGKHTLSTLTSTQGSMTLGVWQTTYNIYTP